MVTKESKLFTHLPDTACEMAACYSAKDIWRLFLVRRMAREAGEGLTDVPPPRVNPLSNRRCPKVPPIALTFSEWHMTPADSLLS